MKNYTKAILLKKYAKKQEQLLSSAQLIKELRSEIRGYKFKVKSIDDAISKYELKITEKIPVDWKSVNWELGDSEIAKQVNRSRQAVWTARKQQINH